MESYSKIEQPPAYNMDQPVIHQPATAVAPSQTVIQINTQPGVTNPMMPRGIPRPWSTTLFSCFDDIPICLCGLFVPCHICCLATDMNESCCFPMCAPAGLLTMRALARGRHNIEGNLCNDCLTVFACGHCAHCQLAREIKNLKQGRAMP